MSYQHAMMHKLSPPRHQHICALIVAVLVVVPALVVVAALVIVAAL